MSECRAFERMEALRASARLFGDALRGWEAHVHECSECASQQVAAQELNFVLASQAAPHMPRDFAARTMQAIRTEQSAAAGQASSPNRPWGWLALNWLVVAAACAAVLAGMRPTEQFFRSGAFILPAGFAALAALLALLIRFPGARWLRFLRPLLS